MGIKDFFKKAVATRRFGYASPWSIPPERNVKGYLSAYGEIYSLFGISLRIATATSEVKWRLYKGTERSERSQIATHPILTLLDFANEFQTGQEIIELTQLHMDLAGKAYWYLPRNRLGVPVEIWIIPPHLMKIVPSEKGFIAGYVYQGEEKVPFNKNEIIRFPMPDPINPYGGIGYAQPAAVELDSEIYAGRWNRNFFYNSARADAVLSTEDSLTEEQYEQLRQQWSTRHEGVSRAHKIAILEGGLKYQQIQVSQKDMDFSNLRKQTRENLLFTFGMPLSVMGISENVNRANAEAGDYTFARWLIKPRLTRIKNKLNEQLLPMFPQAKGVEIDFDEVVPETIDQKKDLAESGVKAGWMTINEARKMNGLDPVSGGEVFLIPFNMMPTPVNEPIETPPSAPPPEEPKSKGFTEEQKEAYWRIYVQKTENQEVKFRQILKRLLGEQSKEVVSNYQNSGKAEFNLKASIAKFKKAFQPLIAWIYEDAFEDVINELKGVKQSPAALEWIEKRSLEMATSINSTTRDSLRIALREGLARGESIPQITDRIKGFFEETYKGRATRIARTEVIAASNEGAISGYEEMGIKKGEFYTALDERVCEECMALHGNIYPMGEAHGLIPVHPSCRCVILPVV